MILYLIHDLKQKTYSHPMVAPDLKTVKISLKQLNPENLTDLKIIHLDTLKHDSELLSLRVQRSPQQKSLLKKLIPINI